MDSSPSNRAFGEKIGVTLPLLSDWKRVTTKDYGLYNEATSYGKRGTFVVDKEGKIASIEISNSAVDPSGALETCNLLDKRKADAAKKP